MGIGWKCFLGLMAFFIGLREFFDSLVGVKGFYALRIVRINMDSQVAGKASEMTNL